MAGVTGFGDCSIAARPDAAVHAVAYFDDATASGAYSGLDAQRVARVAVGLDNGFDALDRIDPRIVGDVTGNGELSGLDASYIAREAIGLDQPEIPDLPARANKLAVRSVAVDLAIALGDTLQPAPQIDFPWPDVDNFSVRESEDANIASEKITRLRSLVDGEIIHSTARPQPAIQVATSDVLDEDGYLDQLDAIYGSEDFFPGLFDELIAGV